MRVPEAAKLLGITTREAYELIADNKLSAYRVDDHIVVESDEVESLVSSSGSDDAG